jgi:hypothetical protein
VLGDERVPAGEDGQRPIEALVDFDASSSQAAAVGDDLEEMRPESQRMVVGDGAEVLEAKDGIGIEPRGPGAVDRLRMRGGSGEAGIVAGDEATEERVGLGWGVDAGHAELGDEAILQGAEEALDASLGLGTAGGDPADAQLVKDAADLRGRGLAAELFFDRPGLARGAFEDPVPIGVAGQREAWAEGNLAEDLEIGGGGLDRIEVGAEDFAGGVIDRGVQDELRAAVFQPGVMAAIELDEHAFLSHALAAGAMAGRTTGAGAAHAGRGEEPMDGGTGEVEVRLVGEQVGEVLMIEAGVSRAGEAQDAGADPGRCPARRGPTAIAVDQGGRAARLIGAAEAPDLTRGQAQEAYRLCHRGGAALQGVEDHEALVFFGGQGDRSHEDRGFAPGRERTFSLNG